MNLMTGTIIASQRDVLGLPVCDLGWAEAFAFAEKMAGLTFGQTVIAFIDAASASRMARDPDYRAVLERQVVVPDGKDVDLASAFDGRTFPASLEGTAFVPALFTYIERPMRIALIGGSPATLRRAAERLRRHTPWHEFLPICDGLFDRAQSGAVMERVRAAEADILLVAMTNPMQEKWIDRHVGPGDARLVLSVSGLFEAIAGDTAPVPTGIRLLRRRRSQLALLYHALRHKISGAAGLPDAPAGGRLSARRSFPPA